MTRKQKNWLLGGAGAVVLAAIIIVIIFAVKNANKADESDLGQAQGTIDAAQLNEEKDVKAAVTELGTHMKKVSLQSPKVIRDLAKEYELLVTTELLARWQAQPATALGKITSSPWPERLEIISISKDSTGVYSVKAALVYATSSGETGSPKIYDLKMVQRNGRWLLSDINPAQ